MNDRARILHAQNWQWSMDVKMLNFVIVKDIKFEEVSSY